MWRARILALAEFQMLNLRIFLWGDLMKNRDFYQGKMGALGIIFQKVSLKFEFSI